MSEEKDLGLRLLIALRKARRTQKEVAETIGITPKYMGQLVNGGSRLLQARSEIVINLARELGVSFEYLLGIDKDKVEEKDFVEAAAQLVEA